MTSEYDELLARLESESLDYRGNWSSIDEASDAIRALIQEVMERDAVIEQARNLHCVEIRYSEDDGETSQDTPTDEPCTVFEVCSECGRIEMEYAADYRESLWPCPTAKLLAQSPRDALAARDAVRDKTVRAAAWWEGVQHQWKHRPVGNRVLEFENPDRAGADQEETKTTNGEPA